MKISKYVLLMCLFVGPAGTAAFAAPPKIQDRGPMGEELATFDRFLETHPVIDLELRRTPGLVDDPQYVDRHLELREFLRDHPNLRRELKAHPNYFMEREERFKHSGPDANVTFMALRNFDEFLDGHPAIAQDLSRKPVLIDNRPYLDSHIELREFLKTHPVVSQEIRKYPNYFMERERSLHPRMGY
jgi:hypothetical protein